VPFTVATNEADTQAVVSVFPNPADQVIHVRSERFTGSGWLCICNALGQKILQQQVSGLNLDINVKELPTGLYTMSILNGEDGVLVSKFVVRH
jgi:hypothetical protein